MNKYPLIAGSICAIVLIVLASLTNVVGYQTVQTSNQRHIADELSDKAYVFQAIVDTVNNKEVQKAILGAQITGKRTDAGLRYPMVTAPVLTTRFLNFLYRLGLIICTTIGVSQVRSMLIKHQESTSGLREELAAVVRKDSMLSGEWTRLADLGCDCEEGQSISWKFPAVCTVLFIVFAPLAYLDAYVYYSPHYILWAIIYFLEMVLELTALTLNCWWA